MLMRRNREHSIRAAQATSLSRATTFNRSNVDVFYDNFIIVMARHKFELQDIYSMGETGIIIVQKPDRVVARRGAHQVGSVTSAEEGTLVAIVLVANALVTIPPFFVFQRERYQDHFIWDGPIESAGTTNSSGLMQDESYMHFLQHLK